MIITETSQAYFMINIMVFGVQSLDHELKSMDCNSLKVFISCSETDDKSECQKEQISQFDIIKAVTAFVR